jgi:hypothetical protein
VAFAQAQGVANKGQTGYAWLVVFYRNVELQGKW